MPGGAQDAGYFRLLVASGEVPTPEVLPIEGFLNECSRSNREELAHLYVSDRPAPDLMLFRMTLDVADLARG